jgi:hypothetical protein
MKIVVVAVVLILAIMLALVLPIVPVKELSPVAQIPGRPIYLPLQYKSPSCWVTGPGNWDTGRGITYYMGRLYFTCNLGFA